MYWSCRLFCWRSNCFFPVGKHVLVGTANTSVVYQVDHQGSTRSRQSSRLTQQLWLLAYPQCICQGNAFARHSKHGRGFVIPAAPTSWEMEAASTSGGSNLAEIGQGRGGSLRLTVDDALSPLVFSEGIYKPLGPGCTGPCVAKSAAVLPTLGRILRGNHKELLISPKWPGSVWFPILHRLLDGEPWCLPVRLDHLSQLGGG